MPGPGENRGDRTRTRDIRFWRPTLRATQPAQPSRFPAARASRAPVRAPVRHVHRSVSNVCHREDWLRVNPSGRERRDYRAARRTCGGLDGEWRGLADGGWKWLRYAVSASASASACCSGCVPGRLGHVWATTSGRHGRWAHAHIKRDHRTKSFKSATVNGCIPPGRLEPGAVSFESRIVVVAHGRAVVVEGTTPQRSTRLEEARGTWRR